MPLETEVGLGPGHIVLNGNPAPPQKGAKQALFSRFSDAGFKEGKACVRINRGPCLLWPNG